MKKQISKNNKDFNNYLKIFEKNLSEGLLDNAAYYLIKIIEIEPTNFAALNELGSIFAKQNDFPKALSWHLKALDLAPQNSIILTNVGLDLTRLNRFDEAEVFLIHAIKADKINSLAYLGLTNLYQNTGNHAKSIELSTLAISIFPQKSEFHVNLGISLLYLNFLEEAEYCFRTALLIEPQSVEAQLNIGHLYSIKGDHYNAIELYENLISIIDSNHAQIPLIKYNLSYEYLSIGDLNNGWKNYEYGFEYLIPFFQRRRGNQPNVGKIWNFEDIGNKTLLVWAEQGLGDQIMFLSLIPDLLNHVNNIIIECDIRLVDILKRSFPTVKIEPINNEHSNRSFNFDYHIPIGSLNKFFRTNIHDYNHQGAYLVPEKYKPFIFDSVIEKNKDKVIIGICWRSELIDIERSKYYLPLLDWGEIFQLHNAVFINLQYGECESELIAAEEAFNIKIHRWPSINLKNDLDIVFSLISRIDLVITAGTAVSPMAFSIGTTALTIQPFHLWTNLGTDYYPWSKHMKPFIPKVRGNLKNTLADVRTYFEQNYERIIESKYRNSHN